MKKELKTAIIVLLLIFFLFSLVQVPEEYIEKIIEFTGPWGPFAVFFYFVFSQVLAPISGTPGGLIGLVIYKDVVFVIYYLASMVTGIINFYISRKLGRKWVEKLGGKDTLKKVDKLNEKTELEFLKVGRVVGFPFFDVISYAAGFTTISFKKYYWITAVYSLIPALFFYGLYKIFNQAVYNVLLIILAVTFGLICIWWLERKSRD